MSTQPDFYALLGVPRNASSDEIRRAYREAALRLHPDRNERPGDTEQFLLVNRAYEILIDPKQRTDYDKELKETEADMLERASFRAQVLHSRKGLLQLDEPQVHYILLDIKSVENTPVTRPPINVSIVIDRSTSMRGQRLDKVRAAALALIRDLHPRDSASIVAFSDRAEVIVNPDQARDISVARARLSLLQAGGGTEIAQGLEAGIEEIERNLSRHGINHLILLTDGRTYGDEEKCIELSDVCAKRGITINGVGIGSDWSDRLLDDLATRTGGSVVFLDSPRAVSSLLEDVVDGLEKIVASRLTLEGALAQQVDLRSAFRLLPEPMPMGDGLPLKLGHLPREGMIRVLLELVVHPIGKMDKLTIAHLTVNGDLLTAGAESVGLPLQINIPVSDKPDSDPPPDEIVSALSLIALYRMQDKARHEAELGQSSRAARRLENLATHLLANGERELARAALTEADRLNHTRRLSQEGEKFLKYGTRALLLPGRSEQS